MSHPSLRNIVSVATLASLFVLSGCYSMNGYVMNASGQGYYEKGNYAMAAQEFQTALSSNPTNADYMANLAKAKVKMGDAAGAEQLYRQALTSAPAHQPSYHGYSELLLAQGRSQEALRMLNTWAATQPYVAESHVELAWLQRELGQHDAAANSLHSALQVNPNHATALSHLGQHYHDAGRPDQAIEMYQRSLQANWNQPEVQSKLASAASTVGPRHPMGEIAMARGVHPHSIPRQQLAAGQVNPAMAMNQFPMVPQQAMNPFPDGTPQQQIAYQSPTNVIAPQGFSQTSPVNQASAIPVQPMNPIVNMSPVAVGGADVTMLPQSAHSSSIVTPVPASTGPPPSPVPDPAFSTPSSPPTAVTSISQSTELGSEPPEVDAF